MKILDKRKKANIPAIIQSPISMVFQGAKVFSFTPPSAVSSVVIGPWKNMNRTSTIAAKNRIEPNSHTFDVYSFLAKPVQSYLEVNSVLGTSLIHLDLLA